jgi:hypothetical protein
VQSSYLLVKHWYSNSQKPEGGAPPQDWQVFPKENPNLKKIEAREDPQNTKEKMDPCFTHVKFGPSPTIRFYFIFDSLTK